MKHSTFYFNTGLSLMLCILFILLFSNTSCSVQKIDYSLMDVHPDQQILGKGKRTRLIQEQQEVSKTTKASKDLFTENKKTGEQTKVNETLIPENTLASSTSSDPVSGVLQTTHQPEKTLGKQQNRPDKRKGE